MDKDNGPVSIRFATAADAAAFSAAFRAVMQPLTLYNDWAKRVEFETYAEANVPALLAADPKSILLACAGGDIAGLLVTRPDDGPLWLSWFGVLPSYRGRGLADQLFARAIHEAKARGIGKIWCDTRVGNIYAIATMKRHGFTQRCRLDHHWFGLDFLIWEKFLD